MLTPEMELDGDLGIDSIKRVEIFAAFQEKFPSAPAVQSDQLGSLRRLSDVLDFLGAAGAATHTTPANATTHAIAAPAPANGAAAVGETEIFAVIAEKTGYPAEMLHLDMELDGDLGIDSIKRVEIFAAFQEKFPGAPSVQSDQLGSLRTLRSVVDFLGAAQSTGALSPAAPAAGASVGASDILAVIAEKTGYPAEMLHLEMELDGDLGIDSIKRVEIFAAFQEKFPNAPSVQSDQLGTLRRLSDVVAFFDASVAAVSAEVSAAKAPTNVALQNGSAKGDDSLQRLIVRAVPRPSQEASQPILIAEGAELWITDDGSDLAAAIASRLEALAFVPRIVAPEDADSLEPSAGLRGVIVLAPEAADDRTFLANAFRLTRRALPRLKRSDRSLLVTVSRCDGMFGFGDGPVRRPLSGGLAGLAKTVGHECPMVTAKAIDISDAFEDAGEIAVRIVQEMFLSNPSNGGSLASAACGAAEIGLTPEQTWTLGLVSCPLPAGGENASPLAAGDVLVVTGGARGVTAEVAVELARSYQPTVVLLGRSALSEEPAWLANLQSEAEIKRAIIANATSKLTPKEVGVECARILANREVQQNLARLRDAGSKVVYRSADVRDRDEIARVLDEVAGELGPVRGIVHGAGVLADRKIEDKTDEQFEMVFTTKVVGLEGLLAAVDPAQLKVLVLFSSSTARFGRTGQVDYAIANECLNKLGQAFAKDHPSCRVVSVNWGPWAGGMVTDSLAKLFQEEGLGLIGLSAGAEYLRKELAQTIEHPVEVVILGGTTATVAQPNVNGTPDSKLPVAAPLPLAFERVVDLAGHAFLDSHRLAGLPVVPMAVMVEWLAHGALHGNPGFAFHGFDDLRVLKGIILRGEKPVTIRVHAGKAVKSGSLYSVPVELRGTDENGKEIIHSVAKIVLADRLPTAQAEFELGDDPATRLSPVTIYDEILFHGNHFQGIGTCELYADGIVIQSETTPPPGDWLKNPLRTSWLADPLALDTSFQAMIVWSFRQRGGRSLPSFAGRYRQFKRSFPRDGVRTIIKVTKSTSNLATASIEFLDGKGELIARMDQYECVIDPALEKAFQHPKLV
jgi:NAD(P)-dependent dehydrogenase (short-subunit alcohol dehydrogenase family)/acyl carrier protein